MVASLEWDELPIARRSLLPGRGFFEVRDDGPAVTAEDIAAAEVLVVADPDADGLTATAIVREAEGSGSLLPTEPRSLVRTLETVAEAVDDPAAVYVLDLSPETFDEVAGAIRTIVDAAGRLVWFDHHEWAPGLEAAVADAGVDVHVGDSDEVSTADVALAELGVEGERWVDLVAVVRDHDLWLREDPRSDDIADYAHWSDPEEFIETVSTHGADLPDDVIAELEERRREKQALIDAAVARAEYRSIGDHTLGITYGRCSQNEVAEAMRRAGADAAVVIKPSGGISLRGTGDFQRCHEVAARLGGGGHPKAAGCKPDIYTDMLDYAHHWTTQGASARHAVLGAFEAVLGSDG